MDNHITTPEGVCWVCGKVMSKHTLLELNACGTVNSSELNLLLDSMLDKKDGVKL